jgi:lambda repressor-like predicted transcriptional regulator
MSQRPDPPPWGALITSALRRGGMSARQAARRAGLSEGRWRQISGGYQVVRPGVYASVRGPAGTLARMAAVAGVSADELRAAGRSDAALAMEGGGSEQLLERIRSLDGDQARELLAQVVMQLGLSGR